ncbi:TonB-dependent receptor [Acidocella sp.]|jgi:outer membrane receptor protein involved in Fe transport|uniref:TonB-dependent receptor n=1 Tax=Acidocella sp. TaxID=50710 RepID=UPI002F3E6E1D
MITLASAHGQSASTSQTPSPETVSPTPEATMVAQPPVAYTVPQVTISTSPVTSSGINIAKWPHPVQQFSTPDLNATYPASLTKTLNEQATGVNLVNSQANPYQPTILYHGFEISPIQGTPAGLSVYVDGARFNQPFGDIAIWSLIPNDAISSLTLEDGNPAFGLNALGGAINVQMKNGFNYHGGEVEVSGGSFDTIGGNLQYGKQVGNIATYIDVGETHEGGWRDLQSSDIQNFYGDFGWRGSDSEFHINLTLANSVLAGPGTVPVQILDADPSAQFTGPNAIADRYLKVETTYNDQLTKDTSLQLVGYYDYLLERLTNGNGPNDLPCGPGPDEAYLCQGGPGNPVSTTLGGAPIPNFLPTANASGFSPYSQLDVNTTNTNGYGGSVQLTNTMPVFGLSNHLVGGLSYDGGFTKYGAAAYDGGITDFTRVFFTPPGIPNPGFIVDEPGSVPVDVVIRNAYYGAYLSDTLDLTKKLALTFGGRFNIANTTLHDQNPPDPNAPGAGLNGGHYYMHVNPTIGATYNLRPALTLFGSYSEENATPTPAELSCASPEDSCSLANFLSGDPDLKQIVVRTFEAGFRGAMPGPASSIFSYNADYYHSVTNDDIEFLQSPFNPIGSGFFSNIGNVLRQGMDLGMRLDATRWQVYLNYSLTDATYQSSFIAQTNSPAADANGNITIMPGDRLPGIPEHLIKFGGNYKITPRWTVGVTALAETSSFLFGDEANLTPQLPGYFVVNLTTKYQITPKLEFFGEIDNVTNERYYEYGTFSPTGGPGTPGAVFVAQDPNYDNPRSYSIAAPIGVFVGVRLKI